MRLLSWIILCIIFFIIEIIVPGTFYFVSLSIGFIIAGISTFFISNPMIQWIIFAACSILSILIIKPFVKDNKKPTRLANVDGLKGQKGVVTADIIPHTSQGQVKVNHEDWRAVAEVEIKKGEIVHVLDIEGTHLIVKKA